MAPTLDKESFLHWDLLARKNIGIEVALSFGKVFWPDLIQVGGFILLKEHYDQEYLQRVQQDLGRSRVESTINTTYLRDLFGDQDATESTWEYLGDLLSETWRVRAELMFPRKKFKAPFTWYSDIGDPGLTLYQETIGDIR